MSSKEVQLPPHVLMFPLPAQGHLNPMFNLAQLLCSSNFHVTFIVSEFNHRRLLKHTSTHPRFQFQTIPDGLPDDHPRAGRGMMDMFASITKIAGPCLKKMLIEKELFASAKRRPVTCLIADGLFNFAADFAEESGIPLIYFRTSSACAFWAYFCANRVIEANEIPFQENGMDELVKSIPGMEGLLRCRDLPSFRRVDHINDDILLNITISARQTVRAKAVIMNTFEDLEQPVISDILKHIPRLYTIGPVNTHLKARFGENKADASIPSASLWAEDRSCIGWLNAQEPKSVIYVSFGSIATVTREQLLEFWHGLVNSEKKFLWAMMPDYITGEDGDQITAELDKGTKENGYMVKWVPQEEVLNHSSVGGFLTHCGWNSTLESIIAGVPMICWPHFGDQMVNSRFVSEVWKVGLDIKDTCDRFVIEKAVREVMEVRKDEFLKNANHLENLAKMAVSESGSSYNKFNGLMEYIESFIV